MNPRKLALLGALAMAIWLPRGLALDRFVTVDEPSWLTFSGNFYRALVRRDLARTYQIGHPGVTTTWIGLAAFLWRYPGYAKDAPRQLRWTVETNEPILRAHGHHPLDVLAAGRAILVLTVTIVLVLAAAVAMRVVGLWPAVVGFLFIAADPFHIALSRVLHVDALAGSFMFLSLLAFVSYLHYGRRERDLLVSGIAAGLAWLTKAPTLFLVPFVGGLTVVTLWPAWRNGQLRVLEVRRAAWPFVVWSAIGTVMFLALWPAMWVRPVRTLGRIVEQAIGYARSGHGEAPLFFNGAIVQGDPGALFYPITYLWRSTPVVLVGLGLAVLAFAARRPGTATREYRYPAAALACFAVLFTAFMSLGAKKFDRYLLPVYPPLDLIAAVGWVAAARSLTSMRSAAVKTGAAVAVGLAVALQVATAFRAFPYYFSYYNPMLGGARKAPEVMMIGWGEGLDQAARALNAVPNAEQLLVSTWFWNGPFSYYYKGRMLPGRLAPPDTVVGRNWREADYCVVYINQRQRGRLPRALLDDLEPLRPAMTVRIQGLEYVQIYDLRHARTQERHGAPSHELRPGGTGDTPEQAAWRIR